MMEPQHQIHNTAVQAAAAATTGEEEEDDGWNTIRDKFLLQQQQQHPIPEEIFDFFMANSDKPIPSDIHGVIWEVFLGISGYAPTIEPVINDREQSSFEKREPIFRDCTRLRTKFSKDAAILPSTFMKDGVILLSDYCSVKGLTYDPQLYLAEILTPIFTMGLSRKRIFHCFYATLAKHVPVAYDALLNQLLRLLLQFHDPELCLHLQLRCSSLLESFGWKHLLLGHFSSLSAAVRWLDSTILEQNPNFLFFLALALLINDRENLLKMDHLDSASDYINNNLIPKSFVEVVPIHFKARQLLQSTHNSYREPFFTDLFPSQKSSISTSRTTPTQVNPSYLRSLCLCISAAEALVNRDSDKKYFIVDVRSKLDFDDSHVPTALNLNSEMVKSGDLPSVLESLQALKSRYICFIGSLGSMDNDAHLTEMVHAFVREGFQYVSVVAGGFSVVENLAKNRMIELTNNHVPTSPNVVNEVTNSLSSIWAPAWSKMSEQAKKLKSLAESVANTSTGVLSSPSPPPTTSGQRKSSSETRIRQPTSPSPKEKNVTSPSKDHLDTMMLGTLYKDPSIFVFPAKIYLTDRTLEPRILVITEKKFILAEDHPTNADLVYIHKTLPLEQLIQIKVKKKRQDFVTVVFELVTEDSRVKENWSGMFILFYPKDFIDVLSTASRNAREATILSQQDQSTACSSSSAITSKDLLEEHDAASGSSSTS